MRLAYHGSVCRQVVANILHSRYDEVRLVSPSRTTDEGVDVKVVTRAREAGAPDDALETLLVESVIESHEAFMHLHNTSFNHTPFSLPPRDYRTERDEAIGKFRSSLRAWTLGLVVLTVAVVCRSWTQT